MNKRSIGIIFGVLLVVIIAVFAPTTLDSTP